MAEKITSIYRSKTSTVNVSDSEVESEEEDLENDLKKWLSDLSEKLQEQEPSCKRKTLTRLVTLTNKKVMDSFRNSILERSENSPIDLDSILSELCELESQLHTQKLEISDSLQRSEKSSSSKNEVDKVGIAPTSAAKSSKAAKVATHEASEEWGDNLDVHLQNALAELGTLIQTSASNQGTSLKNLKKRTMILEPNNVPEVNSTSSKTAVENGATSRTSSEDPTIIYSKGLNNAGICQSNASSLGSTEDCYSTSTSSTLSSSHSSTQWPAPPTTPFAGSVQNLDEVSETRLKMQKVQTVLEKVTQGDVKKLCLSIYTPDGSKKSVLADEKITVARILDILVAKNHVKPKLSWSIVELLPDLHMERLLEDHEYLVENVLFWLPESTNNKLMFVEREDKFDVFLHPESYLLKEGAKKDFTDSAKQELIQEYFAEGASKLPEMEGLLHLKGDAKKSWKSFYFILKPSGLYYNPKGKSKTSKDLVCLHNLELVEIYTGIDWKRQYKAPTDFCFALKHPQIQKKTCQYIKYLCAESQKAFDRWTTAIRIIKNGNQLLLNFNSIKTTIMETEEIKVVPIGENTISFLVKQNQLNVQASVSSPILAVNEEISKSTPNIALKRVKDRPNSSDELVLPGSTPQQDGGSPSFNSMRRRASKQQNESNFGTLRKGRVDLPLTAATKLIVQHHQDEESTKTPKEPSQATRVAKLTSSAGPLRKTQKQSGVDEVNVRHSKEKPLSIEVVPISPPQILATADTGEETRLRTGDETRLRTGNEGQPSPVLPPPPSPRTLRSLLQVEVPTFLEKGSPPSTRMQRAHAARQVESAGSPRNRSCSPESRTSAGRSPSFGNDLLITDPSELPPPPSFLIEPKQLELATGNESGMKADFPTQMPTPPQLEPYSEPLESQPPLEENSVTHSNKASLFGDEIQKTLTKQHVAGPATLPRKPKVSQQHVESEQEKSSTEQRQSTPTGDITSAPQEVKKKPPPPPKRVPLN